MQKYIELDSFTAVAAGEIANLVLANGVRYDEIHLETNVPDSVEYVRLVLNATEIFKLSRVELNMLNKHDKVDGVSGYFSLPLANISALMLDSQLMTGLETGLGDNVVLEVKLASNATAPKLKAFASTSAHDGTRQLVRTFKKYTVPVTANGDVDFTSLVKGGRVMRMFFKSANMSKLEIKQDQRTVYELTKARNDYLLKRAGKGLIANVFIFNSIKRNFPIIDSMRTDFQNLNFKISVDGMTSPENIEVLVEQMEQVEPRDWRAA